MYPLLPSLTLLPSPIRLPYYLGSADNLLQAVVEDVGSPDMDVEIGHQRWVDALRASHHGSNINVLDKSMESVCYIS